MDINKINFKPIHYNFTVKDLKACLAFYDTNLGWKIKSKKQAENGDWTIVYLDTGHEFELELTTYHKWDQDFKWDLKQEFHIALSVDKKEYESLLAFHKANNVVTIENKDMGIYFIADPEGNAIEILPR